MNRSITPNDWRSQPWKNGLGITHEVWRSPARDNYDVRVSVAEDTTPALFSTFPGYHRWSVLLEPAPITLLIDGRVCELARVGDIVDNDGSAILESTALPAGPTKLLNVLARPGYRVGIGVPAEPVCFAFAIEGSAALARWHARVFVPPKSGGPRPAGLMLWIAR